MIRVMLLSTDLNRGGLPLRIARIAPRLVNLGVEPIVGCLARSGPLASELESLGISTFSCGAAGRFDATCLVRLAKHIRRLDPGIIHAALFHANLAARLMGRLDRQRPIITTTVTIEIERRWHRWLEALTAGMSDLHVANGEAVAEHLRTDLGFAPERVRVVPNAIDLDAIEKTPAVPRSSVSIADDVPLVIWAGRMDPVKDLGTLVEVIAMVSRGRGVQCVLLGDGPERGRIEARVAARGLSDRIRFEGWSLNVPGWMKAADALMLTSRTEGSPNVILEAIACGCPVVAADIASCREMMTDLSVGRLCPSGNVEAFARSLIEVIDGGRGQSRRALEKLRRHNDLNHVAVRWADLYKSLRDGSYNFSNVERL